MKIALNNSLLNETNVNIFEYFYNNDEDYHDMNIILQCISFVIKNNTECEREISRMNKIRTLLRNRLGEKLNDHMIISLNLS